MFIVQELEEFLTKSVVDFHGQFYSSAGIWIITVVFGFLGLAIGFIQSSFLLTIKFIIAGTIVSLFVCAVPWPFYRRNTIPWKKPHDK